MVHAPDRPVGDWNIAPQDDDVYDPAQFRKSTHVTPRERAAFQAFLDDGFAEVTRAHAPGYTYWDYTGSASSATAASSRLRARLAPAAPRVTTAFIDRDERAGTGASDHAPVIVDLSD